MSDDKGEDRPERLALRTGGRRLDARKGGDGQTVRQSFSHGRSKAVAVEVKRAPSSRRPGVKTTAPREEAAPAKAEVATAPRAAAAPARGQARRPVVLKPLTEEERKARQVALVEARRRESEDKKRAEEEAARRAEEEARRQAEAEIEAKRAAEEAAKLAAEEDARRQAEAEARRLLEGGEGEAAAEAAPQVAETPAVEAAEPAAEERRPAPGPRPTIAPATRPSAADEDEGPRGKAKRGAKAPVKTRRDEGARRGGRIELDADEGDVVERRGLSLAALRRRQERERRQSRHVQSTEPQLRDVVLPETITVSELANRMAVRGAEVVKSLMKMGVMASVTQTIDADTAELVVSEFGHTAKRVSEADVLEGLDGRADTDAELLLRAPVVTVMGHVDHGKTSLLDALRNADVVASEAGGITQHIGAYQVDIGSGPPVTFIDTPGHAAFTEMRSRGAKITDVVILVVAANDGVMPQTIEAISHAKAAGVPIVVAINKVDLPDAEPDRVKNELLSHDLVAEDFGGDVQCVPVSALAKTGLDNLIEAVQLQAEFLELKANPNREAQGSVVEARLERGRGVVATVLVQRGTLRVGDIVVCGAHWGRVRAMLDDRGGSVEEAGPSKPVELLGLDGVPTAGDQLDVVENEKRAREITAYRQRKLRDAQSATGIAKGTVEDLFKALQEGTASELPVVVKTDVHGSLEAIQAGLEKLSTSEVKVRILHGAVGGITESDVTLARASSAMVIGFNVRANAQARDMAKRDGVDLRYYSIIYELLDDAKAMLSGMLTPESKETITGHAEIREVFNITKVGKVAGCRVVDGLIRRGAKARLLRDDVVIYEGELASLKRFKEDVREVKEGFECGMSITGYNDIREGDVIEAFEVQEVARTL
ncbi:MAG: translation initiation factor IF-2 [Geminicoccaceae bacterium]|nr:MAG: translation initiation factor IF-2 [Geminicoccaceae bacterium]